MNGKKTLTLALLPALLLLSHHPSGASVLTQEMALHAMLESASAALTTMGDYTVLNPDLISNGTARIGGGGISWSGSYGDAGWSYSGTGTFGGLALTMNLVGIISGAEGSDIVMGINGTGMLGTQPLLMQGSSTWLYDALFDDYFDMHFAQQTKIGAASYFGWLTGRERIKCALAGTESGNGAVVGPIAGPVVLTSVASLGKKTAYGSGITGCRDPVYVAVPPGLTAVASSGKKGSLVSSTMHKSALSTSNEVAPPLPVAGDDFLAPSNLGTLVQLDGALDADDMDNRYRSSGRYANGSFSGLTLEVPEPGGGWLVGVALLGLGVSRRRGAGKSIGC